LLTPDGFDLMDLKQNITIPPDTLSRNVGGETVLLNSQSENYFGLDEVGTRVWQLLQSNKDLQRIFDLLIEEFEVEPDRLQQDLINLTHDLNEAGLIILSTNG
jgi:hypothetical protein